MAVGVLAVIAVIAVLTFRDHGLGWDDFTHSQHGELLLSLYSSGFRDTRALSFVNLYMYGGGFDMAAALLAKVLPFDLFETRRLAGALVGLIGLFATWRLGRRIGGARAGLVALMLLATCSLYYGHMFMNPKDVPFAVAMAVFLLGLVRVLEEYPQPSPMSTLLIGAGLGLAVGSRIMGGFGVLYGLAAVLLIVSLDARVAGFRAAMGRLAYFTFSLLPGLLMACLLMVLIWPWVALSPLNLPRAIGYFANFFEQPWQELFAGALVAVPDMPRTYVPTLLLLQMPEIFLALGSAGIVGALMVVCGPDVTPQRRAVFLSVTLAAILPIVVAVITRPAMYNGIRHFIFVIPPLAVLGGFAANWIAERLHRFGRVAVFAAVFVAGIASPVVEMARLHPYEYVHFNRLAGGARAADSRYMLDYWGLSFKQAGEALRAKLAERGEQPPSGRKWKIAVCGPHPPAVAALGEQFEPTWDPKGADFALMLGAFYCARLDAPLLAEVERAGVTFARAYDIRGRTVQDLFTIPPVERDERMQVPAPR